MSSENLDQSFNTRRGAFKAQDQSLDQVFGALQGLWQPIIQMNVTCLNMLGKSCMATATMIESWQDQQPPIYPRQ